MTKQIIVTGNTIFASGRNDDFPKLSASKPLSTNWDSRKDFHSDYLDLRPLSRNAENAVEEIQSRKCVGALS